MASASSVSVGIISLGINNPFGYFTLPATLSEESRANIVHHLQQNSDYRTESNSHASDKPSVERQDSTDPTTPMYFFTPPKGTSFYNPASSQANTAFTNAKRLTAWGPVALMPESFVDHPKVGSPKVPRLVLRDATVLLSGPPGSTSSNDPPSFPSHFSQFDGVKVGVEQTKLPTNFMAVQFPVSTDASGNLPDPSLHMLWAQPVDRAAIFDNPNPDGSQGHYAIQSWVIKPYETGTALADSQGNHQRDLVKSVCYMLNLVFTRMYVISLIRVPVKRHESRPISVNLLFGDSE